MKNLSHLSLVRKAQSGLDSTSGSAFELAALTELSTAEQRRVEKSISQISANAAVIGVQISPRTWDLRPVVVAAKESGPSLIRFLGPEVTLSNVYTARTEALFRSVTASPELSSVSPIVGWGSVEGQLWYRRAVVDSTLAEYLLQNRPDELSLVIELARGIIGAVEVLQAHQLVHGHLTPENIAVLNDGTVALLDTGVSVAVVQACASLGLDSFPLGYNQSSFAPELLSGDKVPLSADIYGLGLVLNEVFKATFERNSISRSGTVPPSGPVERNGLRILSDGLVAMTDQHPARRATIAHIKNIIGGRSMTSRTSSEAVSRSVATQGGMVGAVSAGGAATVKIKRPTGNFKASELGELRRGLIPDPLAPIVQPSQSVANQVVNQPATSFSVPTATALGSAVSGSAVSALATTGLSSSKVYAAMTQARQESVPNPQLSAALPVQKAPFTIEPLGEVIQSAPTNDRSLNEWQERQKPAKQKITFQLPTDPSNLIIGGGLGLAGLLIYFFFFSSATPVSYSREELELAWLSKRPSQMSAVAEAAVRGDDFAEMLVVGSTLKGENLPAGIDASMLRIAFDERWERELNVGDRKLALTLGLAGLLNSSSSEDLPQLDSVHPGVILGITASAGKNVTPFLNRLPISILGNLPPPVGPAFIELALGQSNISCGNEATRSFARFATRSIEDGQDLVKFLSQNTQGRLRALAILFSQDSAGARQVLDVLLNHPNLQIEHELISWARTSDLLNWSEISNSDQLLVLAGIPPTEALSPESIGKSFAHPLESMRAHAIKIGLDTIKFSHPGAWAVLKQLIDQPKLLGPKQTVQLANFLESPGKANRNDLLAWLKSEPPVELVATLVLATAKETDATKVDFEFARFLQQKNWEPKFDELVRLAEHPDKFTRFFAYTKIYGLTDVAASHRVLSTASRKEQIPEFQQQLRFMLSSLEQVLNGGAAK